jgi:hypothetical protein
MFFTLLFLFVSVHSVIFVENNGVDDVACNTNACMTLYYAFNNFQPSETTHETYQLGSGSFAETELNIGSFL